MDLYTPFKLEPSWQNVLAGELTLPYVAQLAAFVARERVSGQTVYPAEELVFQALSATPFSKVKVVIVGQDPYHGPGQAHGLSFSVNQGMPIPHSLHNIYKEMNDDVGITIPSHGCLLGWAEQGVLLLNATLTVRRGEPMSHAGMGWERLTDAIITQIAKNKSDVVFLLWGRSAQEKGEAIQALSSRCAVFKAAHPSPFSAARGFFGCRHFSKANEFLVSRNQTPINWQV